MANYAVDPAVLLPYVPKGVVLDLYQGRAIVSLVGFLFKKTNIYGIPIPKLGTFEEVNLRFYVRYNDNGIWKRGTVFIKEIVPKRAISFIANAVYREKYATMKMRHLRVEKKSTTDTSYEWKFKNKWNKITAESENKLLQMPANSEEEFIAEHYWGYSKYNAYTTYEYQVSHPRWEVSNILNYTIDCDFSGLYSEAFSFLKDEVPSSVFMIKGSEITIHPKKILR